MNFNFFNVVVFFAIVVNGLWYYIKYIVKQNGYESHLFWGHFGDIQNLHSLVNKEQDATKKSKLQNLLYAFYITLFLTITSFIASFVPTVFIR